MKTTPDNENILNVEELSVTFHGEDNIYAVTSVSFSIQKEEALGFVGETGCGKSVVANSIMGLLPPEASIKGRIFFEGKNLLELSEKEFSKLRGNSISIIFQTPSLALNPVHPIGKQIAEPLFIHGNENHQSILGKVSKLLERMGFVPASKFMKMYPSQCSGGMNQRFLIAASSLPEPSFIIADEPTKGLDSGAVKIIAQELQQLSKKGTGLMLISHDLNFIRGIVDRIAVMYAGEIVEIAITEDFFKKPLHPYSEGLLHSLPEYGFIPIAGMSPAMREKIQGCRFYPRCPYRMEICKTQHPELQIFGSRNDSSKGSSKNLDLNSRNPCINNPHISPKNRYVRCFRCP